MTASNLTLSVYLSRSAASDDPRIVQRSHKVRLNALRVVLYVSLSLRLADNNAAVKHWVDAHLSKGFQYDSYPSLIVRMTWKPYPGFEPISLQIYRAAVRVGNFEMAASLLERVTIAGTTE